MPGAEHNMIRLRPTMSIHLQRHLSNVVAGVRLKNSLERNQRKHKIGPRYDESNRRRLIKPNLLKERRRIIHERIESTQLLKRLHATSNDCLGDVM